MKAYLRQILGGKESLLHVWAGGVVLIMLNALVDGLYQGQLSDVAIYRIMIAMLIATVLLNIGLWFARTRKGEK